MNSFDWHHMMHQTGSYARNTDPLTSDLAAESVPVNNVEAACLVHLQCYGGRTSEGISEGTGIRLVTVSPRLKPMEERGLIYRNGTMANRSGRPAIIWHAMPVQGRLL